MAVSLRQPLSSHLFLGLTTLAALTFVVGCKSNPAPKAPAKQGAEANPADGDDLGGGDDLGDDEGGGGGGSLGIEAPSGQSWSFPTGNPINISFTLTGADGKDIEVGFAEKPNGATVSTSGSNVTMTWPTPLVGKHKLSFVVRDMEICEEEEGSADKCALGEVNSANSKYDITSTSWEFDITGSTTVGGTGTGGGGGGGGGTDNAAIIKQITDLLGGGGDITGLLQGLGGGDLAKILQGAQGGNLDIASLLGGIGLHGGPNVQVPADKLKP